MFPKGFWTYNCKDIDGFSPVESKSHGVDVVFYFIHSDACGTHPQEQLSCAKHLFLDHMMKKHPVLRELLDGLCGVKNKNKNTFKLIHLSSISSTVSLYNNISIYTNQALSIRSIHSSIHINYHTQGYREPGPSKLRAQIKEHPTPITGHSYTQSHTHSQTLQFRVKTLHSRTLQCQSAYSTCLWTGEGNWGTLRKPLKHR